MKSIEKLKRLAILALLFLVSIFSSVNTNASTNKYTTIEMAADEVREKVENIAPSITVFFKSTISSPQLAYETFKKELTKETDNGSQGDYIYWNLKTEIPKYIYYPAKENGKTYYYYQFDITYEYYITKQQKNKLDTKVEALIKSFGFTSKTTNYKKIKTIYDYVCHNVNYSSEVDNDLSYTAYSALFNGNAVCQGYSQLMYKMLKEAGVSVRLIPGYSGGEMHGWNIVKIGKYYYNIDATWDALNYHNGQAYKNFLKGDTFDNHVRLDEYNSSQFYSLYPMAKSDYGAGTKTLSVKSKRAKFRIIKPKFSKIKGRKVTVKKVDSGVKYIIEYSTKSNFKNAKKITSKTRTVNLSKLKKGKKYYVRFRASKKISGKTVYTKWSSKKTIILK